MIDPQKYASFQWDKGNLQKSQVKHGITSAVSEEVFLDGNLLISEDIGHSDKEKRYIAVGRCFDGRVLFVVFTTRVKQIRIISARIANKKERRKYEKEA
ncbi:BrnT family toxin [Candidatus Dojkabacteria bacterium]|nr:BrnT family toxin [Candidatus Dojkabacteria bacterium]